MEFYKRLGFDAKVFEAEGYVILTRGDLEIHFFNFPDLVPAKSYSGCYVRVADADEMHRAFSAAGLALKGIPRLTPVENKPWGMREFALVDLDGNLLRVGHRVGTNPAEQA